MYRAAREIPFLTLCRLIQDVSCNEIQALPAQVGRLQALRELNIRKNCLHMLPEGQSNSPFLSPHSLKMSHRRPVKNHIYSVSVGSRVTISALKITLIKTNIMSQAMMSHNTSKGSLKYNNQCINNSKQHNKQCRCRCEKAKAHVLT